MKKYLTCLFFATSMTSIVGCGLLPAPDQVYEDKTADVLGPKYIDKIKSKDYSGAMDIAISMRDKALSLKNSARTVGNSWPPIYEKIVQADQRIAETHLLMGDAEKAKKVYIDGFNTVNSGIEFVSEKRSAAARSSRKWATFNSALGMVAGAYVVDKTGDASQGLAVYNDFEKISKSHIQNAQELESHDYSALKSNLEYDPVRFTVIKDTEYYNSHLKGIFNKIGRVRNIKNGGFCTGSFVGLGLVLTNAHCVINESKKYSTQKGGLNLTTTAPKNIKFILEPSYPSTYGQKVDLESGFDRYDVATIHTHKGRNSGWDGDSRNDWAILELVRSYANYSYIGSFIVDANIDSMGDTGEYFLAGYNGDLNKGRFITAEWGCSIVDIDGMKINNKHFDFVHNCDSTGGSSGSPIIKIDGHDEPVVHIQGLNHSGRGKPGEDSYAGFGVSTDAFLDTLLKIERERQQ